MVVTSHADGAVAIPFRATVFQGNVLQRTDFHALAASNTFVCGAIFAVVGGEFVET